MDKAPITSPRNPDVVALAKRLQRTPEEVADKMREIDILETGGDLSEVKPETIRMWQETSAMPREEFEAMAAAPLPWETATTA